jgi:hypothetical protein
MIGVALLFYLIFDGGVNYLMPDNWTWTEWRRLGYGFIVVTLIMALIFKPDE